MTPAATTGVTLTPDYDRAVVRRAPVHGNSLSLSRNDSEIKWVGASGCEIRRAG